MIKISFYISSLQGGGAERVFLNLMNYLSNNGCLVELVLNQKQGLYLSKLNNSVNIHELDANKARDSVFELASYITEQKPDLVFSTLSKCNVALSLATLFCHAETKIVIREANSFMAKRDELSRIRQIYERMKIAFSYRMADNIFVNSEGSRADLSHAAWIDKENIEILPNPLDLQNIRKKAKEQPPKSITSFLRGRPYIVAVGRLEKAKGFDILIKAFKSFANRRPCLVIMGEGSRREALEDLTKRLKLKDRVILPGYLDNPYSVMAKAGLFVLSSYYEGMPNVLLEAVALDLPIVATDCPSGPRELLKKGKYGRLVPVSDVEQLSIAMEEQFEEENVITKEREEFIQGFSVENIGEMFLGKVKSIVKEISA